MVFLSDRKFERGRIGLVRIIFGFPQRTREFKLILLTQRRKLSLEYPCPVRRIVVMREFKISAESGKVDFLL